MHTPPRDLHRRSQLSAMEKKSLEEREPALISLPIPLPSIPIVGPILDPIVAGNNQPPTPTTSTAKTSPTNGPTNPGSTPTTTPSGENPPNTGGGGGGGGPGTSTGGSGGPGNGTGGSGTNPGSNPTASGTDGSAGPSRSHDQNSGSNPTNLPGDVQGDGPASAGSSPRPITIYSNGVPIATQTIGGNHPGGTDGGVNGNGEGGDGANGTNGGAGGSSAPKLSPGVIAAICIVIAISLLAIFVIAGRRRAIAKRSEKRSLWWKNAKRDSTRFSAAESHEATAGTRSCRSSFATTFDHGSNSLAASTPSTPPLPPMAELRDTHASGLMLHSQPQSPIHVPSTPALINFDLPVENNDRRNSTFSTRSAGSDKDAQFLVSNHHSGLVDHSPMSVRPFSPSELFSFPKPPPPAAPPALSDSPDPFRDPVPAVSENATVTDTWTPLFFGTEVIRRPFAPTLHDEIAVEAGETVRVGKVFDDGWALIEKFPLTDDAAKGKSKQLQGLIPIDCLREAGQDLSKFIASTRVSSYSGIPDTNMGSAV